jgi:hypothetical protein
MNLVPAIIPIPGDSDYRPKFINDFIRVKEHFPKPVGSDGFIDGKQHYLPYWDKPQPYGDKFQNRRSQPWEAHDESELTRQRKAERDAETFRDDLRRKLGIKIK